MKKRLSILVALIMAFTIFWIPGQSVLALEGDEDEGTVQALDDEVTEYTVTFNSNGGPAVPSQTKAVDESGKYKADQPDNPGSWEDANYIYTFDTWCSDEELQTPFDFDTELEDSIILYARWNKSEITVGSIALSRSCNSNSITLKWTTVTGKVDKVIVKCNGKSYSTSGTSVTITGLKGSTNYSYTAVPYYKNKTGATVSGSIRTDGPVNSGVYQYYYKNGSMVKNGLVQFKDSRFSDGKYKMYHYYDSEGKFRGRSAKMYNTIKNDASKAKYLIAIDRDNDVFCVYAGSKGNRYPVKYWLCVCGRPGHKTPCGRFTVKSKKWGFSGYADNGRSGKGKKKYAYTVWHATRFCGSVFVHSQLYKRGSKSSFIPGGAVIGENRSHGCVRLYITYAAWVKNNCAKGTVIRVMTK